MKRKIILIANVVAVAALFFIASHALAEEYEAMKGIRSADAVFDVREGDPKGAARHLRLIHRTHSELTAMKKDHVFVVVFIGPSVKLVSSNRAGFSAGDQKYLDQIADTLLEMSKDGIRLEICLTAVKGNGVDPASLLPQIKIVENGWISLIGYQARGYALVPVY